MAVSSAEAHTGGQNSQRQTVVGFGPTFGRMLFLRVEPDVKLGRASTSDILLSSLPVPGVALGIFVEVRSASLAVNRRSRIVEIPCTPVDSLQWNDAKWLQVH